MKPVLNLIKFDNLPILEQLRIEEALLRANDQNWCLINTGSPPAIVMGISGNPSQLINRKKWIQHPIPIIKRFSGGGTVVVDEDTLFVTFICQSSAINISPFPGKIMEWSSQFYQPMFGNNLFQLRENDYVLQEKKWGGNAQSIIKNRWLHHSSLLWDFKSHHMDYLLIPPKMPEYRNQRTHEDFLCRLNEHWDCKTTFLNSLFNQITNYFNLSEKKITDIEDIFTLPYRKTAVIINDF